MLVKIAPCDTRSRDPENAIQNKAVVPWTPPAPGTPLNHKWLKTRPFLVAHQSTNQDSLPQSYLESDFTLVENPLCQHVLVLIKITKNVSFYTEGSFFFCHLIAF